jgi:membrane protease YdiL (CAAX protease family)
MQAYLDLARLGKNDWWRFVLAILLILFMWLILGALPAVLMRLFGISGMGEAGGFGPGGLFGMTAGFVALMLPSVFFMAGIYLAVRIIHQRPFRTLLTPVHGIDWVCLLLGFGVWFFFAAIKSITEGLLHPGRYVWTPDMHRFFLFVLPALILVPIQTSAEEIFFRGYILQSVGLRLRNIWVLSFLSGFFFLLPHLVNPEASVNYPLMSVYYFAFGSALAFITLRNGRLELALGVHAANNFFTLLVANYTLTALPSPSLFTIATLDPFFDVPATLLGLGIFVWLFTGPLRQKQSAAL